MAAGKFRKEALLGADLRRAVLARMLQRTVEERGVIVAGASKPKIEKAITQILDETYNVLEDQSGWVNDGEEDGEDDERPDGA